MPRTLFAAGRIPARNATRTPETPAMSKITPDCIICHDRPATDRFGWCDTCASLYDEPAEPTAQDLADAQRDFTTALIREIVLAQIAALPIRMDRPPLA